MEYVGFGHLARHIDWDGEAVTFVAQLVGVVVSRGQADLVDFIKGLAESDWFGLEIREQLQDFQGEISALDAELWRSEFLSDNDTLVPQSPPHNLPYSGVSKFVGRSTELETLHSLLQRTERVAISAIAGMGGVGKTELALQYARFHLQLRTYPGGICWLRVRQEDVGIQILQFARAYLGLEI